MSDFRHVVYSHHFLTVFVSALVVGRTCKKYVTYPAMDFLVVMMKVTSPAFVSSANSLSTCSFIFCIITAWIDLYVVTTL